MSESNKGSTKSKTDKKNKQSSKKSCSSSSVKDKKDNNKNDIEITSSSIPVLNCVCRNKNYKKITDLYQCYLCKKCCHKECIKIKQKADDPFICFNCQFEYCDIGLKHVSTLTPATEVIYQNKWENFPNGQKILTFDLKYSEIKHYENFSKEIKGGKKNNSKYYFAI